MYLSFSLIEYSKGREETQEKIGLSIILEENSSSRNEKYKRKVCNGFALKIDKKIWDIFQRVFRNKPTQN